MNSYFIPKGDSVLFVWHWGIDELNFYWQWLDLRIKHVVNNFIRELQYDSITKACWSAAKIGFDMLNATARYIFSYRYGYKVNGKWSGMIADLKENKADIGKSLAFN